MNPVSPKLIRQLLCACLLWMPTVLAGDALRDAFQRGLLAEEAQRDFKAAADAYAEAVRLADTQRELVSTALFRLAEMQRRLGRTNEALVVYRRLVTEFSDQTNLVVLARAQIPAEFDQAAGKPNAPGAGPGSNPEVLLREEIRLAEEQAALMQRRRDNREASQTELLQAQRDVLALKRQLATLQTQGSSKLLVPDPNSEPDDEEGREIERLRRMLANSPDLINATQGEKWETPLQTAARLDQARVVEFLLAQKADLNVPLGGSTPLHLAAKAGHKRMVEVLLKAGAKPDAQARDGQTPLHLAIEAGHRQVAQTLISAGANLTLRSVRATTVSPGVEAATPLGLAVAVKNLPLVESLIEAGAPLNEPVVGVQAGARTALLLALERRDFPLAARLLDLGADPNLKLETRPPLDMAVGGAAPVSLLEHLRTKGALLTARDPEGDSLLHQAVRVKNMLAAAWLLEHGVSPDLPNRQGETPLSLVVSGLRVGQNLGGNTSSVGSSADAGVAFDPKAMLALLLKAKADPDRPNNSGYTPLWLAAVDRHQEVVDLLLKAGANPNQVHPTLGPLMFAVLDAQNPRNGIPGSSPGVAAGQGVREDIAEPVLGVLESLLSAGGDPNQSRKGFRLLNQAIGMNPKYLALLLKYKADPNLRSPEDGATPLERVRDYRGRIREVGLSPENLTECERLLRTAGARDEVPNFRVIQVARKSASYAEVVFRSGGTNDPNRFTLLELLAVHYGGLQAPLPYGTTSPSAGSGVVTGPVVPMPSRRAIPNVGGGPPTGTGLGFTDWKRVVIHRAVNHGMERQELTVDVDALVASGDCSRDIPLEWGDIVELPERDHAVGARFEGPPKGIEKPWQNCLDRTVEVVIKGEGRPVKLTLLNDRQEADLNKFSLLAALRQPGLLRTSSDLRNVRVKRPGAPQLEWQLDCTDGQTSAGFWLHDGDIIVVPDAPTGARL